MTEHHPNIAQPLPERVLETSAGFLLRGVLLIEGIVTTSHEVPFSNLYPASLCLSFSMNKLPLILLTQTKSKLIDPDEHKEQELLS